MKLKAMILALAIFVTPQVYATSVLQDMYNISAEEAELCLELQNEVINLSEKLNELKLRGYVDMYIQHEPTYKVVVLVTKNTSKTNKAKIKKLVPALTKYIEIKTVKMSLAQQNQAHDRLSQLLANAKIDNTSLFDLETQKFMVTVENQENFDKARLLINRLPFKKDIQIVIGSLPQLENDTAVGE